MSQPVTIENDALCFEVWPHIGGKISDVVDKADHFKLLFGYPSEIPVEGSQYDRAYANSWYGGWDECLPAVAPGRYAGFPYDGIAIPDHGELWGLPTTAVPTKNGITTVWHGLRFGYRMTRKLYLDGPSIIAEYTLGNLAPFDFRFVWAQHALFAMNAPVEIDLPGATQMRYSHDHAGKKADQPFDWPNLQGGEDFSHPEKLPPARGWKLFSMQRIARPAVIRYPRRGRRLSIEYGSEDGLPAYWGLWINSGGWAGHKHLALSPTTGRFDQLDRSVWDDSAGKVGPMARCNWAVKWTVSAD